MATWLCDWTRRPLPWALLSAAAVLLAAGAASGAPAATITAVQGDTLGEQERSLEQLTAVEEGEPVRTGDDGNCSLLLEEDAVVELCGGTSLELRRPDPAGPRIVQVDEGEARVVVEPQAGLERIQIHTPAGIAIVHGTVVFVSVNAATKTTLFTSADNPVTVRSQNPNIAKEVTIRGGEQVRIAMNEPPEDPVRLPTLENLGGCLVEFHALSLENNKQLRELAATERLAETDLIEGGLPGVGSGPEGPIPDLPDFPPPIDPNDVLEPTDENEVMEEMMEMPPTDDPILDDCPPGIPGEQCGF